MNVYESLKALSPDRVLALPRQSQESDWSNMVLPTPLTWTFAVDPDALWFMCALPGGGRSTAPPKEFVEGLWEEDVAEFFIKSPNGVYQEVNIAPSGAWWSMTLDGYRVRRESPVKPEVLHLCTSVGDRGWSVVAAFSRVSMEVGVTPHSLLHVSGMWYQEAPNYLSSRPLQGVAPDYHHEGCFEPVAIIPCSD
ncbi:MAG: hypothetical protein RL518_941 [Pseudomonadota bacterium]|jgi:hypothetical protein